MLETLILGFLCEADMHGYELKQRLTALSGYWRIISDGTLYPALQRLLAAGRIAPAPDGDIDGGRKRRVYRVTPAGRAALLAALSEPAEHDISDRNRFFGLLEFLHRAPTATQAALLRRRLDFLARARPFNPPGQTERTPFRTGMLTLASDFRRREIDWLHSLLAPLGDTDTGSPS
jgi:DNA-binding PadR family transcriptional regulator